MLIRALIAAQPSPFRSELRRTLRGLEVAVSTARSQRQLWKRVAGEVFDIVIVHQELIDVPGEFRPILGRPDPAELILVATMKPEAESAAMAAGAVAVLNPERGVNLKDWLTPILKRRRTLALSRIRADQSDEDYHLGDFTSRSAAMRTLIGLSKKVAHSDTSLLIHGETGVGKGWLARAIHEEGPRSGGPFVSVNLAAVPESLMEGELFGYEEGAFTGAIRSHRGFFELAHKGTLFLDEVAELPSHVQVKLLQVLQDRVIQRVGGEKSFAVDVRVVAATNRDLETAVRSQQFRDDLYYRLSVVSLRVPTLRERPEDIRDLLDEYFEHYQRVLNRKVHRVDPGVYQFLGTYRWPGNVRELMNIVERSVLLCENGVITLADLPQNIQAPGGWSPEPGPVVMDEGDTPMPAGTLPQAVQRASRAAEVAYLDTLLRATQGRIGVAAARAGISSRTLFEKMKQHGLLKETYKRLPLESLPPLDLANR